MSADEIKNCFDNDIEPLALQGHALQVMLSSIRTAKLFSSNSMTVVIGDPQIEKEMSYLTRKVL